MGLGASIKRTIHSVTPTSMRNTGGIFITHLPTGAGTLTADAVVPAAAGTFAYGAVKAVISATANTTECWVEGIVVSTPSAGLLDYYVAVTTATAIATGTAALPIIAAEVGGYIGLVTDYKYWPLGQRVFIPANVQLGVALATAGTGAKTLEVQLVISRNK